MALFDVDLDDARLRELQQRIASSTAPAVRWHHVLKENPAHPGNGFLLIAVPRSPHAPHAVTATPVKATTAALRYPRRGGSTTEWLTETYVATAYHQRFTALAGRQERMRELQQQLAAQETDRNVPHLLVTLVPDVPGDMPHQPGRVRPVRARAAAGAAASRSGRPAVQGRQCPVRAADAP